MVTVLGEAALPDFDGDALACHATINHISNLIITARPIHG
jgi:hypothetical protein